MLNSSIANQNIVNQYRTDKIQSTFSEKKKFVKQNDYVELNQNTVESVRSSKHSSSSDSEKNLIIVNCLFDEKTKENYKQDIIQKLQNVYNYEQSTIEIEKIFNTISLNYGQINMLSLVQDIYIEKFDDVATIIGLCRVLREYEVRELGSYGFSIMIGLLHHLNEDVIAEIVTTMENWGEIEKYSHILRSMNFSCKWLKEYIANILNELGA